MVLWASCYQCNEANLSQRHVSISTLETLGIVYVEGSNEKLKKSRYSLMARLKWYQSAPTIITYIWPFTSKYGAYANVAHINAGGAALPFGDILAATHFFGACCPSPLPRTNFVG